MLEQSESLEITEQFIPDEEGGILVEAHLLIFDPDTDEIIVSIRA